MVAPDRFARRYCSMDLAITLTKKQERAFLKWQDEDGDKVFRQVCHYLVDTCGFLEVEKTLKKALAITRKYFLMNVYLSIVP